MKTRNIHPQLNKNNECVRAHINMVCLVSELCMDKSYEEKGSPGSEKNSRSKE